MRVLVQRVTSARVTVEDIEISRIGHGLLLFVGIHRDDTEAEAEWLARKIAGLRVFEDDRGKMNRSLLESGGSVLSVPQFTLYGSCERGRRPDFTAAAPPDTARALFDCFCAKLVGQSLSNATGAFQEHMHVSLVNDGPVTLWIAREKDCSLDSVNLKPRKVT